MYAAHQLCVDDVEAAMAILSDVGREIVRPAATAARDAMLRFAQSQGWRVVSHTDYAKWCATAVVDGLGVVVLDPLFPSDALGARALSLRLTRVTDSCDESSAFEVSTTVPERFRDRPVAIVDDTSATGGTLERVVTLLSRRGIEVAQFLLCAGTDLARTRLAARVPSAQWSTFDEGDFDVIHLRDGCPYLPFSGRRSLAAAPVRMEDGWLPTRVPVVAFIGNLWDGLYRDTHARDALRSAERDVVRRMSEYLGRSPKVSDIRILGSHVAAPTYPGVLMTTRTPLDQVLG